MKCDDDNKKKTMSHKMRFTAFTYISSEIATSFETRGGKWWVVRMLSFIK